MASRQRAVVVGGSMSGLLAARVLSDHFKDVVLFERDAIPSQAENRKGVPQGQHAHALLASGRLTLEKYFPGLKEELHAVGALKGDFDHVRWFDNGVYHARFDGLEALVVSRPRLETHVRSRLAALPNVRINDCRAVDGIASTDGRVTGINCGAEVIPADLVVDASGRGSQSPAWLEAIGFRRPTEDAVRVGLGYATRIYQRNSNDLKGDIAVICPSAPPHTRGGAALAMEGDRWMVTLFGMLGDHPPTDAAGFNAFARTLPGPDIFEVISRCTPLSDAVAFKFPQSTRRHYELLDRFPGGYLVFGDALCSFNPIYGQGMSTAALQAAALDRCLAGGDEALAKRFFTAASKVIDAPWTMAVGGDLRYGAVDGPRTAMMKFINWYIGKLHIAAAGDPAVARAFHRVANMLDPPPSIMKPGIAFRILQGNLRKRATPH
jgi:2-polyprenyl-6-methoxyphenol hydroxylase-like FAD-dependent oxidoreductase